ncbi:Dodecaprenyl-phosphate galacturonate synthase [Candidatus Magnetomoraceae bacterium gMMP-15]
MKISIIIPIFNEEDNIELLYEYIIQYLDKADFFFEVIFINDGSTDASDIKLRKLTQRDGRFKLIELRRNFGQTAAMMAGFDFASGNIIIPMDGDLQNDFRDIPRLIDKIKDGYDVCSGWRKDRKDHLIKRKLLSRIANKLISTLSGVKLNDYGCTLKAYKSEILKGIKLYGEMHRFIPIYAKWQGAKITEIPVIHHPRTRGISKYGMERTFKVILDLLLVIFFSTLSNKPIYIFGGFGFINIILSFLSFFLMIYFKFWGGKSFIETPLPQLVILFFLIGFISILMGFIAEILMRTYYESQGKSVYTIKKVYNINNSK